MSCSLTVLYVTFLFLICLTFIGAEEEVLVLTDDNIDAAISEYSSILVKFCAPWSSDCQHFAPEYTKVAKLLADSNTPIKLAKVDVVAHKALAEKYYVHNIPMFKYFQNGSVFQDYPGDLSASSMHSWLTNTPDPFLPVISTDEELTLLRTLHDVVALGVFDDSDSGAYTFRYMVENLPTNPNVKYAISLSEEIKNKLEISNAIVVLKNFADYRNDFLVGTTFDIHAVEDFINAMSIPFIHEFSLESSMKIFKTPVKYHGILFSDKLSNDHDKVMSELESLGPAFRSRVIFVHVPASEIRILEYFEVQQSDFPLFMLCDVRDPISPHKYVFSGSLDSQSVSKFLESTLASHENNTVVISEDVTVVHDDTFETLVLKNDLDVFIQFYAPYDHCDHCKELEPTWQLLGKHFKNSKTVLITKMDASQSDVEVVGHTISGFPDIYLFKRNDKSKPIKYEGGRDLDSFMEFLTENAHLPIAHDEL